MAMENNKGGGEDNHTDQKENDKCLDNHDKDVEMNSKPSRLQEMKGRAKKIASNKHNVVIIVLAVLVFVLFITVIALSVRFGTYLCPMTLQCRTSECLGTATEVVGRMDTNFKPCEDFYSFSCNGWVDRHPLPRNKGSYSILDQQKDMIDSRIKGLVDLVPYDADPSSAEWKVKSFYAACRDLKEIEHWVPTKITQAIHEIGGWALINDSPGSLWKRNDVLKKLQVVFGVEAFFKILVEADDSNPTRNIIKLVPGGLGLPSARYYFKSHDDRLVEAYKDFIQNTAQTLGVNLYDAQKFAVEVFNYEKRIAEATPEPEILRNTKDLYRVMRLSELDGLSSSISWTEILQSYFPNAVRPDTEVAVLSRKYFEQISSIISSTDNNVLNNYYMWRLMHTFVPHSSSKFRLVANRFKQAFEGTTDLNLSYEDNWEFCVDVTNHFLGHAIGQMYIKHYYPESTKVKIQNYLYKLEGALTKVAREIPWLNDEELQKIVLDKIRSMITLSGSVIFGKNPVEYYKELQVRADYFQNIKDGVYFIHRKQEQMLKHKPETEYSFGNYAHDFIADYQHAGNRLVVPAGLFDKPLFDVDAPLPVKYGILAAHMANKIAEAFDDKGINYNQYGTLRSWVENNTLDSLQRKEDCLKNKIGNYTVDDVEVEMLPNVTVSSLMADIGGIKIAYEAYLRHSEENSDDSELLGVMVNNEQLFYLSYAQSLCQVIKPEKVEATKDSSTELPSKLRVQTVLQQLPEFSRAFSCRGDSVMTSTQRCNVF